MIWVQTILLWIYNYMVLMMQLYKYIMKIFAGLHIPSVKLPVGIVIFVSLLASCSVDDNTFLEQPDTDNFGNFELRLEGRRATRATTTIISKEEADQFLITVFKGSDVVRETTRLKDLNTRLSAGYGYTIKAENCSMNDAESVNGGWGQRRYAGISLPFAIKAGETTQVGVGCSVANAGIEIIFDETIMEHFTESYNVTIKDGDRVIVFDAKSGGTSIEGNITAGEVAYFNVPEDGVREISYVIEAYGQGKKLVRNGSLSLSKAKISRLTLTFVPGTYDLNISVDTEDIFVEQNIGITGDDVVPDDGSTDMDGNHDSFGDSDENVDISDYEQL